MVARRETMMSAREEIVRGASMTFSIRSFGNALAFGPNLPRLTQKSRRNELTL